MKERRFDLQQVIESWGWGRLERRGTSKQKKQLKKQRSSGAAHFEIKIDWSRVCFEHETKWKRKTLDDDIEEDEKQKRTGPGGKIVPLSSILFQTVFENDTKKEQEYTMRTQRVTKSTCTTEIENTYTKSQEIGLTLKAPGEVFEANAGFSREFQISRMHGETFEHEMEWEVQSMIKVPGEHKAEAELRVMEEKKCGRFEIETKISGTVTTRIYDIEKNKAILTSSVPVVQIVGDYLKQLRKSQQTRWEGVLSFVEIVTEEEKVDGDTHEGDGDDRTAGASRGDQMPTGGPAAGENGRGKKAEGEAGEAACPEEDKEGQTTSMAGTFLAGLGLSRFSRARRSRQNQAEQQETLQVQEATQLVKKVVVHTSGFCRFRYGIKQNIHVQQKKIAEE